jgi:hypothetical protein
VYRARCSATDLRDRRAGRDGGTVRRGSTSTRVATG